MRNRHRISGGAAALAALALFATACSGSASDSAAKGSSGKSSADTAADKALKFRKCLREQGLDVPEPKPGEDSRGLTIGNNGGEAAMKKAMDACRQFSSNPSGEISQADKDKALKFAQCMRKNGVDMPDPNFGGGGGPQKAMPMPQGAAKEKFDKANKLCSVD
ncbi:hypothetical protein [Streptomyces sp. H39-S7]|uniref:hypothetical protein n=1 Tax=Streptomyces sp. H39-S7 TaxID=3004357 RepID=UPI0022AF61FB|nr:hypothetical protein [Streptomyces sp. H39-S7]MCZ4120780.1 hypothetical protein [Streptomyces sp. H39-S7]